MAEDDIVSQVEKMAKEVEEPKKDARGRTKTERKSSERKPSTPTFRTKPLKPRLESFFTGMGMLVFARDQVCGTAIAEHAPAMAEAYAAWADQSPRVRAMLERLLSGGAGTEALMSMVPVLVVVLAHHNMLPASLGQRIAPNVEVNPNGSSGPATPGENAPPVP